LKWITAGVPILTVAAVIAVLTVVPSDPEQACAAFPDLRLGILTVYGLVLAAAVPLLTCAAVFLIRRKRAGLSSTPRSD
jgi:uncharacterized membrane protein YozB (DUF420 family)